MIKRILCMLVSFAVLASGTAVFAIPDNLWTSDNRIDEVFAGSSGEVFKNDMLQKLLMELGIISKDVPFNPQDEADYAVFMQAVMNIQFDTDAAESNDVLFQNFKESGFARASQMPKKVLMDDAIYACVKLAGYDVNAQALGGEKANYLAVAGNIKLLRGCEYHSNNITNAELAQILYNTISIPSQVITQLDDKGNAVYEVPKEQTLLERKYDMEMKKGVVTAYNRMNIYEVTDKEKNNIVEIDRVRYMTDLDMSLLVGQNVRAFVTKDDDIGKLILAEPENNEIYTFEKTDIISMEDNLIKYETEENQKRLSVSSNTKVIYNGLFLGDYNTDLMESYVGDGAAFTLIDNGNGDDCDVLIIWEYVHCIADNAGKIDGIVKLKYDMQIYGQSYIDFSNDDIEFDIYKTGMKVQEDAIAQNNVLSIAASVNQAGQKNITIQVSASTITGMLNGIQNNYECKLDVNSTWYSLTEQFKELCGIVSEKTNIDVETPTLGTNYTYYLSFDGKIADIAEASDAYQTVYMVRADKNGSIDVTSFMKVFTLNSEFVVYELEDKVTFYDGVNLISRRVPSEEVITHINNSNIDDPRTLLKIKLNGDGKISKVVMPMDCRDKEHGTTDYPFTYDYNSVDQRDSGNAFYYGQLIDMKYFSGNTMPVFQIPDAENASNEKQYAVIRVDSRGSQATYDGLKMYNIDDYYKTEIAVWQSSTQVIGNDESKGFTIGVVRSVNEAINAEGDVVLKIDWHKSGPYANSKYMESSDEEINVNDTSLVTTEDSGAVPVADLKCGDVIQVSTYPDNSVKDVRLLFSPSNPGDYRLVDGNGNNVTEIEYNKTDSFIRTYGQVLDVNAGDGLMKLTYSNDGTKQRVFRVYSAMIVLVEDDRVSKIGLEEIRSGDVIFGRMRYAGLTQIVVYR